MNTEDNHIIIEVLNSNGDIKLTKMRNPREMWQNNEYPDKYIFKDVDYVNIFSLIQENNKLKKEKEDLQERIDKAIELIEKNSELTHIKTILHIAIYSRKMEDVTEVLETLKGEDK